ncbi:MAG: hypothetical protein ACRDP6_26650 [Actinoallomurus sp.]
MVSSNIKVVLDALASKVDDVVKRLVLEIVAILRSPPSQGGTPRDTGWASANWIASVGKPFEGVVGSRDSVNTAQQAASLDALLGYKTAQGSAFISNSVPYIVPLNFGHSKQAPAGFVNFAVARGVQVVAGGAK